MEIVFRAAITYFFLWGLTRVMGKRELSEMSAFELILLVSIGDLVQQGVTQEDMSLTGALLAVGTIGLLITFFSYLSFRFSRARPVVEGVPVLIVRDGHAIEEALRIERLALEEVLAEARQHGIDDLAKVRLAILEPDGKFSFLVRRGDGGQHEPAEKHTT